MLFSHTHYLPVAPLFFAAFALALAILLVLLQIRLLRYAYTRLGVSPGAAMALLAASLIGGAINIPIARLPPEPLAPHGVISYFGMGYVVPEAAGDGGMILAVNVGGAVIPTLLSIYLMARRRIWGAGLLATALMAAFCHTLAQPVAGVGVALPTFAPPIAATLVAALVTAPVSWRELAPLAYIGGSLGVLIGADILNLDKLPGLGAPVASIGGAGTFDGIFVTGICAVLLASLGGGAAEDRPKQ